MRGKDSSGHGPLCGRAAAVLLVIAFSLSSVTSTVSARSPNTCVECHDDFYQYIDIEQDHPDSRLPDSMEPGSTAPLVVVVRNYSPDSAYSELDRLTVRVAFHNGNIEVDGETSVTEENVGRGRTSFEFRLRCLSAGTDVMYITADALNSHEDTPLRDEYAVLVNAPLRLSSNSVEVEGGGSFPLTITAVDGLTSVTLEPQGGMKERLTLDRTGLGPLSGGQSSVVTVSAGGSKGASGEILLSWTDGDGDSDSFSIRAEIFGKAGDTGGGQGERLAGRILGWTGTALLVASILLGGFPKAACRSFNRILGSARRRVWVHCLVSWEIMLVALLHAVLLMLGHWSFIMWEDSVLLADTAQTAGVYIDLGTTAFALMGVVGFQGAFQKRLIKLLGPKGWRWSHLLVSLAALGLVLIHAVMVGSTLKTFLP